MIGLLRLKRTRYRFSSFKIQNLSLHFWSREQTKVYPLSQLKTPKPPLVWDESPIFLIHQFLYKQTATHHNKAGERYICSAYSIIRRDHKTLLSLADSNLSSWPDGQTVGKKHTPSAVIATRINKQND